ncbi:BadF/BadG/BcrA/BcrD ATPase family protein [Streptomyces ipomoeae]|jgi:N-acetylglucosamine kinase-like BadF-type ATPase|uniref:N-acetylglucosamine kinase n=1 Tax=Streptomyces ipomoeae TaxID=103232 RepID=UPI000662375C|nr:BadF/BadG/BcrA/BcrD ATPase family protein [Streptomyces ipomoeae]MDX2700373.1 BadF/BadG/BcrA/BcrD ATPase family protein [Streptomyces ipomoeae]MDX2827965.1 BadF/BadG/BcrA/BcrD ATPase family protein [Streptomyces ipomoeae]MDX2843422.1 BadF/BadG/BcrA/BcrD ATPase family protein [Streptomyces ipomoeae]MDX2876061.1 BadF/BadG/BcrA/BcrD ATPase family protein [Streptomyces ipomoeae]TQE19527.1 ATPase [Streptomyces ipomoeae]
MNSDLNQELVVGIDAGGTRTRAVCASAREGRPRGEGVAGPGNALTVPVPELIDHLAEAIAGAVPEALRGRAVAVAGGFAGAARSPADEPGRVRAQDALTAALERVGIAPRSVETYSDIEAAFAGAPGHPADGLALVAGTGAVAARIADRVLVATSGGDGWLLGDDGGGFWIGRSAVRAALRAADGRGRPTALATAVGRALALPGETLPQGAYGDEGDVRDPSWSPAQRAAYRAHLLPAVMDRPPTHLAALAPLVTRAAEEKDVVASEILREAGGALADMVVALAPREGEPLVVTGGLLAPDGPLLTPFTERMAHLGLAIAPVVDGCQGAVALAREALGRGLKGALQAPPFLRSPSP